jgi:hypothetical protein
MLHRLLRWLRPQTILDPELGSLVLRGACWDGAIPFPNAEGSAVIMFQAGSQPTPVAECHRRLVLEVRARATEITARIAGSLTPPDTRTWEIVVIDIQGSTCEEPQLELTLERAEDGEIRSVAVRGSLDSPEFTILAG